MIIPELDKEEFGKKLSDVVYPSRPIRSIQHLMGRSHEIDIIERALYQPGRHIFIFGDRGVGKSSLAATAAYQYQSAEAEPIFVSGSIDDTFKTIIANIANQALGRSKTENIKRNESIGIEWRGLRWGGGIEISSLDVASQIQSIGDAAELLKQISLNHSEKPIVVLDEFDTIKEQSERNKFAALLKQLGDQSINLKFIFTGIGHSLDDLLGAHPSAFRQLETVELPRLAWEARREIVINAADAFGLSINNDINWRIAIVSDGFPYYIHLIMEKMLWEAFIEDEVTTELSSEHYYLGLRTAIQSINAELKRPYDQAVSHRDQQYENVVWSTADGDELYRPLKDMYGAYKILMQKRGLVDQALLQPKFSEHVRKLKDKSYGEMLMQVENRQGWYTYSEKMLRGYVRMQAEANGIELSGEREAPRQKMHVPGNARTGSYGPSIPKGVSFGGRSKNDDS
ncbi:MAG: ATP-binding protein [Methylotenera sp.]